MQLRPLPTPAVTALLLVLSTLIALPAHGDEYGEETPLVVVKAGMSMPWLINGGLEALVGDDYSVQAGFGLSLGANAVTASARRRLCWHCASGTGLVVGFGPEFTYMPASGGGRPSGAVSAIVEPAIVWRHSSHFGWMVGAKVGLGVEVRRADTGWDIPWLLPELGLFTGVQI